MSFPLKYQSLIDTAPEDIELPDYLFLVYAVCAIDEESCGWGGWITDGVFRTTGEKHYTSTGDKLLTADYRQICPNCGLLTYRTGVSLTFRSENK